MAKIRGRGSKIKNLGHLSKLNQIFIIHNQWAPRTLKMQKQTAQNGEGRGQKMKI